MHMLKVFNTCTKSTDFIEVTLTIEIIGRWSCYMPIAIVTRQTHTASRGEPENAWTMTFCKSQQRISNRVDTWPASQMEHF